MKQILVDLYKVEFNNVKLLTGNGPRVVCHETNPEDYIILNQNDLSVIVGEPYLLPLSKYGGGFKSKTLVSKNCCWVGSAVAAKLADKNTHNTRGQSYRMVEIES